MYLNPEYPIVRNPLECKELFCGNTKKEYGGGGKSFRCSKISKKNKKLLNQNSNEIPVPESQNEMHNFF